MLLNGYALYNPENASGDDDSKESMMAQVRQGVARDPLHDKTSRSKRLCRKPSLTGNRERLRAERLATTVGFIQIEPFDYRSVLDRFPKQGFAPHKVIACDGLLCVIERGWVQIRHARDKYLVKTLSTGAVFGGMPEMGQTMLTTEAVAGSSGVVVTMMNPVQAWQWIAADPLWLLKTVGSRLYELELDLHRIEFYSNEGRLADLLLRLAGDGSVIKGITQERIGIMLGLCREIVALIAAGLRKRGVIQTSNRQITILDKQALREMSDLSAVKVKRRLEAE